MPLKVMLHDNATIALDGEVFSIEGFADDNVELLHYPGEETEKVSHATLENRFDAADTIAVSR
jgi:hypothetical protein